MQTAIVTITPGAPDVRVARPLAITRSMDNVLQLTLQTASGAAADLSGALGWEMGVTQDFYAATPILAGSSQATAAANVLTIHISGATEQLAAFLDGKRASNGFGTLKGFDAAGQLVHVYIIPLTLCNIGYNGDLLTDAVLELYWTAAQIEAKLADIAGTLEIPQDISDLTDTEGLLAKKADIEQALPPGGAAGDILHKTTSEDYAAGWVPFPGELAANKATDFSTIDDTKYPSVKAVKDFAQNETLAELAGADVTVAPWTQSKWSASGICSLTATGWAASGRQTAYIVITFAAGSTLSVVGTEAVADGDALSAAGVYECFLKNVDGKIYFHQISFTEAVA